MRTLIVCLLMFLALPAFAHDETDTLHRHDEGGPTATVECSGTTATATWQIPDGDSTFNEELQTGGYLYFTTETEPTQTLLGRDASVDFGAGEVGGDKPVGGVYTIVVDGLELGRGYRAHLLVAYVDGPAWHNDTRFVCPEIIDADVLPFTGLPTLLLAVVGALFGIVGCSIVAVAGRSDDRNETPRG